MNDERVIGGPPKVIDWVGGWEGQGRRVERVCTGGGGRSAGEALPPRWRMVTTVLKQG
jgi:hypothetical protein